MRRGETEHNAAFYDEVLAAASDCGGLSAGEGSGQRENGGGRDHHDGDEPPRRLHSELDAGVHWRNDDDDESDAIAAVSPQAHGVFCPASSPED